MKSLPTALVLIVCLAIAGNVPAHAQPAAYSVTSKSYKSGFSSQKSKPARNKQAAPPANRQSGPGAFGKGAGSPASAQPQRNRSAMSRDVDQGAARANALKNLDARRAGAAAPPPLPPLNDTLRQPGQAPPPHPAPAYSRRSGDQQPGYQPPAPQPSNGLMHGLLGFMLGRAMSQSNQPVAYPTTNGSQPAAQPGVAAGPQDAGMVTGLPGLGGAPAAVPAAAPEPSFGASVLRWFAWLSLLSVIGWAVVYMVRKLRRQRAAPNNSFERS